MRESDSELMTNLFILLRKRLLSFQARIFLNIKNLRQTNATWIVKQPICFLLLMPESKYSYSKMQQPLVLTFYSTRSPEILSWKKLSSESSRVKFKNGIHSTRSSFHCFVVVVVPFIFISHFSSVWNNFTRAQGPVIVIAKEEI